MAAGGGSTGAGAAGNATSWFDKLTPEDKTWAEAKGWKPDTDPSAIATSYRNLEQLFGADKAGRTVVLPKDAEDKAAVDNIFTKLGKPADPTGYSIDLPEGTDPTFANLAKEVFHKNNLTADQAKGVTDWYRAMELDLIKQQNDRLADGEANLKKEWGAEFEQKREVARAAWTAAGIDKDTIDKLTSVDPVSVGKMMEFFGRNYVESGPPGEQGRATPGFGNITPAAAAAKVDQLYNDPNFMARYNSPDQKIRDAAMAEMDALSKVAINAKRT